MIQDGVNSSRSRALAGERGRELHTQGQTQGGAETPPLTQRGARNADTETGRSTIWW